MIRYSIILFLTFFIGNVIAECDPDIDDCAQNESSSVVNKSQFSPNDKNAFSFKVRSKKTQKYPYTGFCTEIKFGKYCTGTSLPYEKYVGMKGVLFSDNPIVQSSRKTILKVLFENGEEYYFGYFTKYGAYSKSSPFVQLSQLQNLKNSKGKTFYKHLTVASTGTLEGESSVILSNGAKFAESYIKPIKLILRRVKSKKNIDRITKLLQAKSIKIDKFTGDISIKHFPYNERGVILTSKIAIRKGKPLLFYTFTYRGDDWLFVNKYSLRYGDKVFNSKKIKFKRDNSSKVWEWYTKLANKTDLRLLRDLTNQPDTAIRFSGKKYYKDIDISAKAKSNLKDILDIYKILK